MVGANLRKYTEIKNTLYCLFSQMSKFLFPKLAYIKLYHEEGYSLLIVPLIVGACNCSMFFARYFVSILV